MAEKDTIKSRIFIRDEDREIYQSIKTGNGVLGGLSNINLFLIAMVLGFKEKGKGSLKNISSNANDGYVRMESVDDESWNIIKAYALYEEEDINILADTNKIIDIAEKYATEGIKVLNNMYFDKDNDFAEKMEKLLVNEFDSYEMGL